jgi:ligand-binding sensor domain-containing protein
MKLPKLNATLFIILLQASVVSAQDISFERVDLPDINIQDVITGITQDLRGNIWFTSSGFSGGSGLFKYDGVHLKSYTHDPLNPSSLGYNLIECIYTDQRGNLWIGTWGDLEKMDPSTGVFIHYKHDPKDPASISGDTVNCILQDHEGMLWIGTRQAGLNRFDTKTVSLFITGIARATAQVKF